MGWQQILSLVCVALAAVFLMGQRYRKKRRARVTSCGGNCRCASESEKITTRIIEEKAGRG